MADVGVVLVDPDRRVGVRARVLVEEQRVADDLRARFAGAVGDLEQAAVGGAAAVLGDRLGEDRGRGLRRRVDDLAAGVLVLALAGEGDREDLAVGFAPEQVDRRVLHRQFRAEVAVDPLHRRLFLGDRALGDQVEDVLRPVLDRRVADPRALFGDDLDHRRVQRVGRVDRRGAALDVVDVGALLADDQRPLELAHVLGVDPEVGLQRHLDLDPGRDVDEGTARPDRRVERGQFVVVGRDDRRPVLADEVLVLAQRGVHVGEDHALRLELLVDLVVDDLGLVLGADAGEEFALRLGDAEPVEGVFDVLGDLAPVAAVLVRGADEVVDVVEVDLAEVAAPVRGRSAFEVLERLEPEVTHPLRLVLVVGDRFDDLAS